jgi:transcriptional regulator with XRE-family HTH domain
MSDDYRLADTKAAVMLREAIDASGLSQREVARRLGYKSSVVVSHMASGRAPIPIDRATEIADQLRIDRATFLAAVLRQRYPELDLTQLVEAKEKSVVSGPSVLSELELLAGDSVEDWSEVHLEVIREVLSSRDPSLRWLKVTEIQAMDLVRRYFPDVGDLGLLPRQLKALDRCLRAGRERP